MKGISPQAHTTPPHARDRLGAPGRAARLWTSSSKTRATDTAPFGQRWRSLFPVGFGLLRALPPDDKGLHNVALLAHEAAYSLLTGSPNNGAPYMAAKPEQPPVSPEAALHPDLALTQ